MAKTAMGSARKKAMEAKRARKAHQMANPGGQSKYARKRAYCISNGVDASSVPEPKPWKGEA